MQYSVWEPGRQLYSYYEDSREMATLNTPAPKHLSSRTLGSTVSQAAWPLPGDARKVGEGGVAIGRIASKSGGGSALGDDVFDKPIVKAGLLAGAAILIYKFVVKGGRK